MSLSRFFQSRLQALLYALAFLSVYSLYPVPASAQDTGGTVSVTVTDQQGAVIPGASLELRDLNSNEVRRATSLGGGTYRYVGLNLGSYSLTVSKEGFSNTVVKPIAVQAARVTDVTATLQVGQVTQTVEVNGGSAVLLETSSNMIGTTIDLEQIEDLPLGGRDLTQLSYQAPGYNGTWNGLPAIAQGNNIDGVIGSPSRMKFVGNAAPVVSARLEDIAEMTVQTDGLDLDQGFGQAAMQINFITRRGSNDYHGRVYEDFRNADLNANSWSNNGQGIPRGPFILNDFGGSVGGHIIKDKLFFFASFSMSKQPGTLNASNSVFTSAAQSGVFTYQGSNGQLNTVNVLNLARNFSSSLPSTINPIIAGEFSAINNSLSAGAVTPSTNPNINFLNWLQSAPTTNYFPTFRVDDNATDKLRFHVAFNETKGPIQPASAPAFLPGSAFADQIAGNKFNQYTASFGAEWTPTPTLVNSFKGGFLYNAEWFAYNAAPLYLTSVGTVNWGFNAPNSGNMSGQQFNLPISNYYPVFNASDSVSWSKGKHSFKFGGSWYREQDHYWNNPSGFASYNLGLANGDPALNAFTNSGANPSLPGATSQQLNDAEQLYAILTGRVSGVSGQFGVNPKTGVYNHALGSTYNLDELIQAAGVFAQDSWRIKSNLTLNYGLRWDFTGDDYDKTGAYHGATPDGIYGPSGIGNEFQPGNLPGDNNPTLTARPHQYQPWLVAPQPMAGFAWRPDVKEGPLSSTVIRGSFSLRRFTEPQQYFWNYATDYGAFYFQQFYLVPNTTGTAGTFAPGSLSLGQPLPALGYSPHNTYEVSAPESEYTFTPLNYFGNIVNGMNPNIAQPYTESWNIGIQKELGLSRVLEVRYNGSRTRNQWLSLDTNEVNVFENGFLKQFQAGQQNLKINQQNGINSFANNGYAGQVATPVFDAAFAGEGSGGTGVKFSDYGNSAFINDLNTGQVGAMANVLSGINGPVPYFCNLVGSSFSPCPNNAGYTGAGAGYPTNYFQANPYSAGMPVGYMDSVGYSNYAGLQIDLRQKAWHGLQFDANYTWSHTLGLATPNSWTASFSQYTLRDMALSYGPTLFDLRQVVHANGTFDLPFGRGRQWLNQNGVVNSIVGGWTLGSIFTFQTGAPESVNGGFQTYNDYADGGVNLTGVSRAQLQSSVGVYHVGSAQGSYADIINPKYMVSPTGGGANPSFITPNTTPGSIGQILYLYGPHQFFTDVSLSKRFAIKERVRAVFQSEFLNAFNHPTFGGFNSYIQSTGFGTGGVSNGPRQIELRLNIEF
jgi:Carboxypeptidase regulatory-like domain